MALSDSENRKYKPSKKPRPIFAGSNKTWSDNQKIEAVKTYLALGNVVTTAAVLKIPEVTLRVWKAKDWWKEIEYELKTQEDIQLSSRLKKIVESTLGVVEDRLQNGDFIYDQKTGKLRRKPVNLRDAHKVAMDMVEKREKLDNKIPQGLSVEAIDEKLTKIAEQMAKLGNQIKKPVIEVTDVIVCSEQINDPESPNRRDNREEGEIKDNPLQELEDALHEEREA